MLALLIPNALAFNIALSDQGTGVRDRTSGILLDDGNLTVLIFNNLTGGTLIYNETFTQSIQDGAWNVMLGETTNLSLEFSTIYYRDYRINGEDTNFTDNDNNIVGRQFFYSPLGSINGSLIINGSIEREKLEVCADGEVLKTLSGQWVCSVVGGGNISNITSEQILDGTIIDADISDSINLTIGEKITFSLGVVIDNILSGLLKITGNVNITNNLSVGQNIFVNGQKVCLENGTNCDDDQWSNNSTSVFINPSLPQNLVILGNLTTGGLEILTVGSDVLIRY